MRNSCIERHQNTQHGLGPGPEGDVHLLELVEAGQHARARHAAENVGPGSLHQGHEAFVLQHLQKFTT